MSIASSPPQITLEKLNDPSFINKDPERLLDTIHLIDQKLNKIIEDHDSKYSSQEFSSLYQVKVEVETFFDRLQNYSFNEIELIAVTDICRKLNEHPAIQDAWNLINNKLNQDTKALSNGHKTSPGFELTGDNHSNENKEIAKGAGQYANRHEDRFCSKPKMLCGEDYHLQEEQSFSNISDVETGTTGSQNVIDDDEMKRSGYINQLDSLLSKLKYEYQEHRIDKAYSVLENIRRLKDSDNNNIGVYESKCKAYSKLINDVECDYREVETVLRELRDEKSYTIESNKKGITTKCKNVSGGKASFRINMTVDVPLEELLGLLYEADNYMSWAPFCKESREIMKISRAGHAAWLKWNLPSPIANREAYVIGKGFNRLEENGTFLLLMSTFDEDKVVQKKHGIEVPSKTSLVRLSIGYTGIELRPVGKERTEINVAMMIDSKIRVIPGSVMCWMIRKGASLLRKTLIRATGKKSGGAEMGKGSREFYDWMESLIKSYL